MIHFKVVCQECGDVISQCRCMSKEIRSGTCEKCKAKLFPSGLRKHVDVDWECERCGSRFPFLEDAQRHVKKCEGEK